MDELKTLLKCYVQARDYICPSSNITESPFKTDARNLLYSASYKDSRLISSVIDAYIEGGNSLEHLPWIPDLSNVQSISKARIDGYTLWRGVLSSFSYSPHRLESYDSENFIVCVVTARIYETILGEMYPKIEALIKSKAYETLFKFPAVDPDEWNSQWKKSLEAKWPSIQGPRGSSESIKPTTYRFTSIIDGLIRNTIKCIQNSEYNESKNYLDWFKAALLIAVYIGKSGHMKPLVYKTIFSNRQYPTLFPESTMIDVINPLTLEFRDKFILVE
ncbi:hypothetical protein TH2_086 [Shewanella phage Thanatos-2]|nr:hypothetical protein TH2_086 [Shewanella phage Thanatos-2]